MSYKLGLILSIAFMMAVLLLSGDLLNVTVIHNSLNALGLTVSYRLSMDGRLTDETKNLVAEYGASIVLPQGEATPWRIGDTVEYYLVKTYDPFVIRKDAMRISVRRSAVIGYYAP